MPKNQSISINITTFTLLKIVGIFFLLYVLFIIKDIVAILFIALIFASAVDPWIDWMEKNKISRGVGILLIYLFLFFILFTTITLLVPPISKEIDSLILHAPQYVEKIISGLSTLKTYSAQYGILDNIKNNLGSVTSGVQMAVGNVFSQVFGIFGGIISFFLTLVITFYMTVDEGAVKKLVWSIAPHQYQDYILNLINRMQRKIGLWLRGQIILCFSIFILTYFGLMLPGFLSLFFPVFADLPQIEYGLVLALIAGITEFVPYIGPTVGAIPAILLSFSQSPILALFVVGLFYVIQLVENNILVPKIMQSAVGLHPVVSISVLIIGYQLSGVVGAILSIPVATALQEIVFDIFEYKEKGTLPGLK